MVGVVICYNYEGFYVIGVEFIFIGLQYIEINQVFNLYFNCICMMYLIIMNGIIFFKFMNY